MNILVTGARSGLGRACAEHFRCDTLTRSDRWTDKVFNRYDVIIHCAFDSSKEVKTGIDGDKYVYTNLFMTQELATRLTYDKFIYISSQDVYPKGVVRRSDSQFEIDRVVGVYPCTKLFSEIAVRRKAGSNSLILRPSSMLGKYMRPSTMTRMFSEESPKLFLSPQSRFNFVRHDDVISFIETAIRRNTCGTFDIASKDAVRLGDIASKFELAPQWGSHVYDVGEVDASQAADITPAFGQSSMDVLTKFVSETRQTKAA